MNRYVKVKSLSARVGGSSDITGVVRDLRYLIVDLTVFQVVADCGDDSAMASKVAQALNALDGGPL